MAVVNLMRRTTPHPAISSYARVMQIYSNPIVAEVNFEAQILNNISKLLIVILLAVADFLELDQHVHFFFVYINTLFVLSATVLTIEAHTLVIVLFW